jgi:hypothetical protein
VPGISTPVNWLQIVELIDNYAFGFLPTPSLSSPEGSPSGLLETFKNTALESFSNAVRLISQRLDADPSVPCQILSLPDSGLSFSLIIFDDQMMTRGGQASKTFLQAPETLCPGQLLYNPFFQVQIICEKGFSFWMFLDGNNPRRFPPAFQIDSAGHSEAKKIDVAHFVDFQTLGNAVNGFVGEGLSARTFVAFEKLHQLAPQKLITLRRSIPIRIQAGQKRFKFIMRQVGHVPYPFEAGSRRWQRQDAS